MSFLRKTLWLWNKLKGSHKTKTSRHSSTVSILFSYIHKEQHGTTSHSARTQNWTQPKGFPQSATAASAESLIITMDTWGGNWRTKNVVENRLFRWFTIWRRVQRLLRVNGCLFLLLLRGFLSVIWYKRFCLFVAVKQCFVVLILKLI